MNFLGGLTALLVYCLTDFLAGFGTEAYFSYILVLSEQFRLIEFCSVELIFHFFRYRSYKR